jgi:hypothetical protein
MLSQPAEPTAQNTTPKRKSNGRDYRPDDSALVAEMEEAIQAGRACSPEDAARGVVERAVGGGSAASKVARLAKHHRETYRNKP